MEVHLAWKKKWPWLWASGQSNWFGYSVRTLEKDNQKMRWKFLLCKAKVLWLGPIDIINSLDIKYVFPSFFQNKKAVLASYCCIKNDPIT